MHLTMILMLDEDHTHYSDAFGNIFEGDALHKKHFPIAQMVSRQEGEGCPHNSLSLLPLCLFE